MNIRRISALTAALSFIVMVLTSIILYIVPQGRIAYWANWTLWGLSKEQWGGIHINSGLLFLIALGFHIYYNWNAILLYLKDKSKQMKIFTKEFNIALFLTLVTALGTYMDVPPFSTILAISDGIKDDAAAFYGEPPYGHAELSSLKAFSKKVGLDLKISVEQLKQAGYLEKWSDKRSNDGTSSPSDISGVTLKEIAEANHVSPQQIYLAMTSSVDGNREQDTASMVPVGKASPLPDAPPAGTGNLTLADLCSQYNLNMKNVIRSLAEKGITAEEALTLKTIAANNGTSPIDLYEAIKEITP